MNHIYQLKFDHNLLELIVVSELSTNTEAKSQVVTLVPDANLYETLTSGSLYDYSFMAVVNYLSLVLFNLPSLSLLNNHYRTAISSDYFVELLKESNTNNATNLNSNFNLSHRLASVTHNHAGYNFSAKNILALSLLASSLGVATNVLAAPTTITGPSNQIGTVVSGTVDAVTSGLTTTIHQTTDKAVIDWTKSFDIKANEIVEFVQNNKDSAVLNRVLGDQVTHILGTLKANGQVFIVNPHGIVFDQSSHVDVGGLVASTLNIDNDNFLKGHYVFDQAKDKAITQVLNSGIIKIKDDGSLALIGGQVVNNGVLEAKNGTVFLLAGNSIEISDLHNPLVSYKVTAKNKAVNLGGILSNGAILLGNQVLNGKPSSYIASTFADVIGSTNTNANQANITSTGEVVLFGGSVANDIQSSDQTDDQVKGERNSIVENNGIIEVDSFTAPNVKILGDYVHTGSQSKIAASRNNIGGGNIVVGGGFRPGEAKLATLDIASEGSSADVSFWATGSTRNGNIIFRGKHTHLDGLLRAESLDNNGIIETSGNHLSFGKHFTLSRTELSSNENWIINSDYFAVVGSEPEFDEYVKGKTIGENLVFASPKFDTRDFKVNIFKNYYPALQKNNYIDFNQMDSIMLDRRNEYFKGSLMIKADKGIVFYNVHNYPTAYLYLTTLANKGLTEIAIKDSALGRISIGNEYVPTVSDSRRNNTSALYISGSSLGTTTINQINKVDIRDTVITGSDIEIQYTPSNQFYNNIPDDSSLTISRSRLIKEKNYNFENGGIRLKSNSINISSSEIHSMDYISFASDESYGQTISIDSTNVTSYGKIDLETYSQRIKISNSNITTYSSFDLNISALPTELVKNSQVVLENTNLSTFVGYYNTDISVGNPHVDQVLIDNVKVKTNNLTIGASEINISDLKGRVQGSVDLTANKLRSSDFVVNSTDYYNEHNLLIDSGLNFNATTIVLQDTNIDLTSNLTFEYNDDRNRLGTLDLRNTTISAANINPASKSEGSYISFLNVHRLLSTDSTIESKNNADLEMYLGYGYLNHSNITTNGNLKLDFYDLDSKNNSKLLAQGSEGITILTHNANLSNSNVIAPNGKVLIRSEDNFKLTDNTINAHSTIRIVGANDSLATNNNFQSDEGVDLSTNLGKGTLTVGGNNFNDQHPIKINCEIENPVDWVNGKDNNYNYLTYGMCTAVASVPLEPAALPQPKPKSETIAVDPKDPAKPTVVVGKKKESKELEASKESLTKSQPALPPLKAELQPAKNFIGHESVSTKSSLEPSVVTSSSLSTNSGDSINLNLVNIDNGVNALGIYNNFDQANVITAVTQNLLDDLDGVSTESNYLDLDLNDDLGQINLVRPLAEISNLDTSSVCRPEFITLANKYNLNIKDIKYLSNSALVYKYNLRAEQAEFLFNCYAHNVGYFSNLYNK